MYKCKECGLGVMVTGLPKPIRMCDCKTQVERKPKGFIETIKSWFGKKYFTEKPAAIIMDMEATAYGRSQFKA